ncbi:uncharacterized protein LOC131844708 [Achroia grisella]|uniref:uncharacterized protein LOC131844708 n=1 Tax=Achroia grisella TaxID=688607 RepID=UPI0027D2037F|nr:uncharacterized protein LOC131844708 [Achroia grisella]
MRKRDLIGTLLLALIIGAGLAGLIWWLVEGRHSPYTTILLEEDGLGHVRYNAALTRIHDVGNIFWWFYPTTRAAPTTRPIILWLDGVTGLPPSLLANFGMFGPLDINMNIRNDSWVNSYNLLFVDSPLGTGFSTADENSEIPTTLEQNSQQLLYVLDSFYRYNSLYRSAPLYIFGEGHGAQFALSLALKLTEEASFRHNLKGVVIGNGIIAPTVALTKLGFYLEELAYVDNFGRDALESFAEETNKLVEDEKYGEAFDKFLTLDEVVNKEAGAVAVNLARIVDKLTQESTAVSDFGLRKYIQDELHSRVDVFDFMDDTVAPALGLPSNYTYDQGRGAVVEAFRDVFMLPADDLVQNVLQNTDCTVTIYNGNLDAVSTTPGQLEWVEKLQWAGSEEFLSSPRRTLIVNGLVEGYFRESPRLQFYWLNAAGLTVPLDSPVAMRRVLERILV